MPLSVRTDAGMKPIVRVQVRDGAVLRDLAQITVRDGTGLRTVFSSAPAANAVASPSFASGRRVSNSAALVTSRLVQCHVSGGRAPYTYAWTGTAGINATAPTNLETAFSAVVPSADRKDGAFICTVTDAGGAVYVSNPVSVLLEVTNNL